MILAKIDMQRKIAVRVDEGDSNHGVDPPVAHALETRIGFGSLSEAAIEILSV